MAFFKSIQNSEFELGFLDYMNRLSDYLNLARPIENMWDTIVSNDIIGFISYDRRKISRPRVCARGAGEFAQSHSGQS